MTFGEWMGVTVLKMVVQKYPFNNGVDQMLVVKSFCFWLCHV